MNMDLNIYKPVMNMDLIHNPVGFQVYDGFGLDLDFILFLFFFLILKIINKFYDVFGLDLDFINSSVMSSQLKAFV